MTIFIFVNAEVQKSERQFSLVEQRTTILMRDRKLGSNCEDPRAFRKCHKIVMCQLVIFGSLTLKWKFNLDFGATVFFKKVNQPCHAQGSRDN